MADLERLEAELSIGLGAALRQYAEEVDPSIDAAQAAQAIARRHPRHRWLEGLADAIPVPGARVVRVVLAVAALVLLVLAAFAVGQSLLRGSVEESLMRGRLDCVQAAPGETVSVGSQLVTTGLTLSCRLDTGDPRSSGLLSLTITRTLVDGRNGLDAGTAILDTRDGRWTGTLSGLVAETGARSGRLSLRGEGPFRELRLGLSVIGRGGLSWAVSGTIGPIR